MQELLTNQWFSYTTLFLNAIVAGQIIWFAIKFDKSKLVQYALFILGVCYAVSIGGLYKAPAFILKPEVVTFWLFINGLFGVYVAFAFIRNLTIPNLALYLSMIFALIGSYTVFTGILEFGMRYMPAILFFTICIYSGIGLVIFGFKVAKEQKLQKRVAYIASGLVFTLVCLNAFGTYQLIRDTAYTDVSEGWEGGITEQQDELSN